MTERSRRPRLTVEVDPDIRRRLKMAAARHDVTIREYVLAAVEQALAAEDQQSWSRLSEAAFARDWDSVDDAVYDAV
jgi:uncharacterized protein (DUF1778 family)